MKKISKTIIIIFTLMFILNLLSKQVKIVNRQGSETKLNNFRFKNDSLFSENTKFSRNDVKKIVLSENIESFQNTKNLFYSKDSLFQLADEMQKEFPSAQGIILIDKGINVLRSDGSQNYVYHFAGKVLGPSAMYFSERSLWFEEGRSRVRFIAARTILANGDVITFDPNSAKIRRSAGSMVDFDNDVYLSAIFSGVRIGAIVEYIYESEEYNVHDPNMFFSSWYFGDDFPVAFSQTTINLPLEKQLYYRLTNFPNRAETVPVITKTDTSISYSWQLSALAPMETEPMMPSYGDIVPHLEATTFADYEYIFDWLSAMQLTRLEITPDIQKTANKIVENSHSLEDSLAQIYYYVQREIEYISIKGSVSSGQTGHSAQFTLDNKYGDCTDKSILMSALYRSIGYEARPIILMTNDEETVDRSLPNYSGNHAIVLLIVDGNHIFLDGTYTSMRFPYCGEWDMNTSYLDAIGRKNGMTSMVKPSENSLRAEYFIKLAEDGYAEFHRFNKLNGPYEANYRDWWEYNSTWANLASDWMASTVPGAVLDSFNVTGVGDLNVPLREEFHFHCEDWAEVIDDVLIFELPGLASSLTFDEVSLPIRQQAIEYEAPYSESHKITILLPQGYTVDNLAINENSLPYFSYTASLETKGDTLIFVDNFSLKERTVPKFDYFEYRESLRRITGFANRKIIIKK